jgi:DNA-binding MarR family transcriptional regulator
MVAKGLLERSSADDDRRRIEVRMTPAGRAMEAPLTAIVEGLVSDTGAGIDPADLSLTMATLRRMTGNLLSRAPSDEAGS